MDDFCDYKVAELYEWYYPPGMSKETRTDKLETALALVCIFHSFLLFPSLFPIYRKLADTFEVPLQKEIDTDNPKCKVAEYRKQKPEK